MCMLSLILRGILLSLGQKQIFSVELLRPFVSVKRFFAVLGIKLLKSLISLWACSDLYAHAKHTGQELMRALSVHVRSTLRVLMFPLKRRKRDYLAGHSWDCGQQVGCSESGRRGHGVQGKVHSIV
jgi:hypothetical protein